MTEMRFILRQEDVDALWTHKDKLRILSKDPMRLHKDAFIQYLEAKGAALYEEASNEQDREAADAYLTQLAVDWKLEAKAHNERRDKQRLRTNIEGRLHAPTT